MDMQDSKMNWLLGKTEHATALCYTDGIQLKIYELNSRDGSLFKRDYCFFIGPNGRSKNSIWVAYNSL